MEISFKSSSQFTSCTTKNFNYMTRNNGYNCIIFELKLAIKIEMTVNIIWKFKLKEFSIKI